MRMHRWQGDIGNEEALERRCWRGGVGKEGLERRRQLGGGIGKYALSTKMHWLQGGIGDKEVWTRR